MLLFDFDFQHYVRANVRLQGEKYEPSIQVDVSALLLPCSNRVTRVYLYALYNSCVEGVRIIHASLSFDGVFLMQIR